jgi:retinol-binding protein 3
MMPTITGAFRFVSSTTAVIIDLRDNGGGSPFMVSQIES